jgi:hypothetical protein
MTTTETFEKGALVRVAKHAAKGDSQPPPIGTVAVINQATPDFAEIVGLNLNGTVNGCGFIPLDCLVIEDRLQWVMAREFFLYKEAKTSDLLISGHLKRQEGLKTIAAKYGLTEESLAALRQEISQLYDES